MTAMSSSVEVLFLSHGGGPLPLLGDSGHSEMVNCLKAITTTIKRPEAIIVVSAHWEEAIPTVTMAKTPGLIYDYYGFPDEAYSIQYPCSGHPGLVRNVADSLAQAGIGYRLDTERGLDHGVFVPLKIMYPEADIPCVQLSLLDSMNAVEHLKLGQALHGAELGNVLVIGSGFSYHNMRAFFSPDTTESRHQNEAFEKWLLDTCTNPALDEEQRYFRLAQWEAAPFARYCHPREEHLLPLHVCYGLAQKACTKTYELEIFHKKSSMFLWQ